MHEKELTICHDVQVKRALKKEETLTHIFWTTLQYLSNRHQLVKRFFNKTIVKPQLYTDTNKIQDSN